MPNCLMYVHVHALIDDIYDILLLILPKVVCAWCTENIKSAEIVLLVTQVFK